MSDSHIVGNRANRSQAIPASRATAGVGSIRALILGAGVVGVTTAYALAKSGFEVTVLEREARAGLGTSAENGAQLSYGFADPISSPATLRRVPAIILGRDPGINVHARFLLAQPLWATRFVRNCLARRYKANTRALTRLALHSRDAMRAIRAETNIDFDFAAAGRLVVYESQSALAAAASSIADRNSLGCDLRTLDRAACLRLEPALANWHTPIAGGIHSASDEVGDAGAFCRELASYCIRELGVQFRYQFFVDGLHCDAGRVSAVIGNGEHIAGDLVVNCLGEGANKVMQGVAAKLPILPLKGYSLTIAATAKSPLLSIASAEHRVVFARIGARMRIAGLAHVRGHDLDLDDAFATDMLATASNVFPGAGDYAQLQSNWCGLRPLTPDGLPCIGKTKIENLYVNAGHGGLGWTLAAGSADLLAQVVSSGAPDRLGRGTRFDQLASVRTPPARTS